MTKVDVCSECGLMFDKGEDHCRRCGCDRTEAVSREMRELCYTYSGEEPVTDEVRREVAPIFEPHWGKVQWYELDRRERRRLRRRDEG